MEITRRQALALPGLAVVMALKPENPVVGGTTLRRAAIRSPNFATGVSGWSINVDGSAEFNNVVIRNGQIVSGTALFYSSSPPAAGNLVASVATAPGTDASGNAYLGGLTSYHPAAAGLNYATSISDRTIFFYTAPGGSNGAGPWTIKASFALDGAGLQLVVTLPSNGLAASGGLVTLNNGLQVTGGIAADTENLLTGLAGGLLLSVTNTTAAPTAANARIRSNAAADKALALDVSGDTVPRLLADSNGKLSWSTGALATDTDLYRAGAASLQTDGQFTAATEIISSGVAGGTILTVTNTTGGGANALEVITAQAAGDSWLGMKVAGDTNNRIVLDTTGTGIARVRVGAGNAAPDITIQRQAANLISLLAADLAIDTAGRGLQIKTGTNAKMGTAVLSAGTKLVANTSVTANSLIFLSRSTAGGTLGHLSYTISAGVSFTITSSSNLDTSTINYLIMEPAP